MYLKNGRKNNFNAKLIKINVNELAPNSIFESRYGCCYAVRKIKQLTDMVTPGLVYFGYFHDIMIYAFM